MPVRQRKSSDTPSEFAAFAICYQAGMPKGGYGSTPDTPPPTTGPFTYHAKAGEPSRTFGYQIALLVILNAIAENGSPMVPSEQLSEFNALFARADQYGAYTLDWAGCRFATRRDGAVFTVEILEPNPRLEARFAAIAKSFGDAHHARCLASKCLPMTAINYNRRRRTFRMAAIAG